MKVSSFDKTDKGREEMATRKHALSSRLRTLLLLFDGKRTVPEVLQKVAGIGLTEQHITELMEMGFIQRCEIEMAGPASAPVEAIVPIVPQRRISMPDPAVTRAPAIGAPPPTTAAAPRDDALASAEGATPLQALYNFYTETIRSAVGLRGYALQIKVERARSVEDFRKMRGDYLAAVEKAQGADAARELDRRLQQLLDAEASESPGKT